MRATYLFRAQTDLRCCCRPRMLVLSDLGTERNAGLNYRSRVLHIVAGRVPLGQTENYLIREPHPAP